MPTHSRLPAIILASGSPRRKELLASLGLQFEIIVPNIDESILEAADIHPRAMVWELSKQKAEAVAQQHPKALVIGSDTTVALDDKRFSKPVDKDDAFTMLKSLQGQTHHVYTGVTVCYQNQCLTEAGKTAVTFCPMTDEQIWRYIETGEPMDKAGAYAIQGLGSLNIERIEGCYYNVVGLPLVLLETIINKLGFQIR